MAGRNFKPVYCHRNQNVTPPGLGEASRRGAHKSFTSSVRLPDTLSPTAGYNSTSSAKPRGLNKLKLKRRKFANMKKQDLLTATTVALGTAALSVAAFWPGSLDAGDEEQRATAKIAQPKLFAEGVELSLSSPQDRTFREGDQPTFELAALNTNSTPVELTLHLAMSASSPADALSRVVRTPSMLWQADKSIVLAPGEAKKVAVPTATKLPSKNLISVTMQQAVPAESSPIPIQHRAAQTPGAVVMLSFSTLGGEPLKGDRIAAFPAGIMGAAEQSE